MSTSEHYREQRTQEWQAYLLKDKTCERPWSEIEQIIDAEVKVWKHNQWMAKLAAERALLAAKPTSKGKGKKRKPAPSSSSKKKKPPAAKRQAIDDSSKFVDHTKHAPMKWSSEKKEPVQLNIKYLFTRKLKASTQ